MSKFDDARNKFNGLDDEDKALAVAGVLFATVVGLALLAMIVFLVKQLFVPALIALAVYGAGVKFFNFPVPPFVKKFYK